MPYIFGMPISAECLAWWKTRSGGTKHHAQQRDIREKHKRGVGYYGDKNIFRRKYSGSGNPRFSRSRISPPASCCRFVVDVFAGAVQLEQRGLATPYISSSLLDFVRPV